MDDLAAAIAPGLAARRPWIGLAVHLACAAAALGLTQAVFAAPRPGPVLLAAWGVAALGAALGWLAALLPAGPDPRRGHLIAGTLAVGAAVGAAAAVAAMLARTWWRPLGHATLGAVYLLLQGAGYDAGAEPERFLVGTPRFVAEITPYCSGYQGIGLMLVFVGAYLWLFRDRLRLPRALWLLPVGAVLAWVLNAARIALLVMIGDAGHQEIAVQGFHEHAGTLFFCATALGLGAWAGRSRLFSVDPGPVDEATAAYVLPFLALLATSLVTGLVARHGVDALYGLRVVAAVAALWLGRGRLASAGWRVSWTGVGLGAVAFAVWLVLAGGEYLRDELGPGLAALDPAARPLWIAMRLAGAVVVVPLVEELAFRGYLARRFTAAEFASVPFERVTWPAWLASAALFGLMHDDVLAGTATGVLYGAAARRRGQLGDAVAAHAVTNALLAVAALAAGRPSPA